MATRGVCGALLVSLLSACGGTILSVNPTPPTESTTSTTSTTAPTLSGSRRARRVVSIQRGLGIDMHYSLSELSHSLATHQEMSCTNAGDDRFHSSEIAAAAASTTHPETVDHWTRVEAGYIAGACPEKLPTFFASLVRLGHTQVVASVEAELHKLGVST